MIGGLAISLLPRRKELANALVIVGEGAEAQATVQLLEDCEYWFQVRLDIAGPYYSDRDDILIWDPTQDRGHLRPGSHVGYLPITLFTSSGVLGTAEVEVRSRKLGYLDDYRWMLRDIAHIASGLVMERFAATQQFFKAHDISSVSNAYGSFEFLKSVCSPDALGAALEEVLQRPHHQWVSEPEMMSPALGLARGSAKLSDLLKPGPRLSWTESRLPIQSVPTKVLVTRPQATNDTVPNRFVKFALTRWRGHVDALQQACQAELTGAPLDRAKRETEDVLDWLDSILEQPLFNEVGELDQFPINNTVLLGRQGYREVFESFGLFELVAALVWSGGDAVYHAGQRDVATLYEYWCFLQLASVVRTICNATHDSLVTVRPEGTRFDLRRGSSAVVSGSLVNLGRRIDLALYFNREFSTGPGGDQSWTRSMRPDCSLRIGSSDDAVYDPVWIHFDAKYRVDQLDQIFSDEASVAAEGDGHAQMLPGRAKRDDLLKMHAYRDAIRRSAGSYVLYPGPDTDIANRRYLRFHEILPGVGAFALRPKEAGDATGLQNLRRFIEDVVLHHASMVTQYRRGRYWEHASFSIATVPAGRSGWQPARQFPAADTPVLLGYVRSQSHLDWVLSQRRYNLRLGGRRGSVAFDGLEGTVQLIVLQGPPLLIPRVFAAEPSPEVWSRAELVASGYVSPGGDLYLCLVVGAEVAIPEGETQFVDRVARFASMDGSPVLVAWTQLVQ